MRWTTNRETVVKFFASVLLDISGLFAAGYFAYLGSNIKIENIFIVIVFVSVIYILLEFYLEFKPLIDKKEEILATFFDKYLESIGKEIEALSDDDVTVRTNIMKLSSSSLGGDQTLSIAYTTERDTYQGEGQEGELGIEFEIGHGVCGSVVENNRPMVATSTSDAKTWRDPWATTETQDRLTNHLCTIIGVPIYGQNDSDQNDPIGVLVVDSESPPEAVFREATDQTTWSDFRFKDTAILSNMGSHARNIGILL
jgi:hypothetical protein